MNRYLDAFCASLPFRATGYLRTVAQILLLAVLASLLYGMFLWNPIVFDDANYFWGDIPQQYGHMPFQFDFRWFPYASLGWTQVYLGSDLIYFRLGNLALHIATSVALFVFLRGLFVDTLGQQAEPRDIVTVPLDWLAFFGALIFALHPVAVYGAGYLIQRSIVMATLFVLLMLICWMKGLGTGKQRWFYLSIGFYFLAVFSKEHSIMAPALVVALTLLLRKPTMELGKRIALPVLGLALIALFVVFKAKGMIGSPYEPDVTSMLQRMAEGSGNLDIANAYPLSVLTQGYLFFKYLLLWLLPNPAWMSIDMREPFAPTLLSMPYLLGFVAFLIYPVLAIRLLLKRGYRGLLGFALLFPWLLFATEIATVRLQEQFVLYRSYLWAAGLFVALPWIFNGVKRKFALTILYLFALMCSLAAWDRLTTLSHRFLLWQDAAELIEGKDNLIGVQRIYYNRGNAFFRAKKYAEAIDDYTRAISINPKVTYLDALPARGKVYLELGKLDMALRDFEQAITLNGAYYQGYFGRATVFERIGRNDLALSNYERSCSLSKKGCDKVRELSARLGASEFR